VPEPSFRRNVVSGCGCGTGCLGLLCAGLGSGLLALGPLGQATQTEATLLTRIGVPLLVVASLAVLVGPAVWFFGTLLDLPDDDPGPSDTSRGRSGR
jgi:hypothetical protein